MSALFDFASLLVVILLFICSTAYLRSIYPTIFANKAAASVAGQSPTPNQHTGFYGIAWKASRIGERLSPYVGLACFIMAFHVLFIKE